MPKTKTIKKTENKKKVQRTKAVKEKPKVEVGAELPVEKIEVQPPTVKDERVDSVRGREGSQRASASNGVEKYYESVGRRKEATARVRVYTKKSTDIQASEDRAIITVNGKPYFEYFNSPGLLEVVDAPLRKLKSLNRFKATVKVLGGGLRGQADAIRLGLSRGLVLFDHNFAKKLRKAGYLTRDSREKERRKYGLKKARKSPQWAKR